MNLILRTIAVLLLVICFHGSARRLTRRVILERHVQKYINHQYGDIRIDLRKPDRKTFSLNITIVILEDIKNMRVFGQIYKFSDNVYKQTALRYEADACVFMETLQVKMFQTNNDNIFKNYIQRCPIEKISEHKAQSSVGRFCYLVTGSTCNCVLCNEKTYWVHNVNETLVSVPFIPLWRAKLDYSFYINDNETLLYHSEVFFQVVEV